MHTRRRFLFSLPAIAGALTSCTTPGTHGQGAQRGIVSVVQWGGTPTPLPAKAQEISNITIHHQGEIWDPAAPVPPYLVRLQNWSRGIKAWVDIPYHYVVAPDGTVYAARPWQIPGDTNTEYQPQGHALVMLLGNFEVQHPTEAQMQATAWLLARLQNQFHLGSDKIATHLDYSSQTVCPGAHLYARLAELKTEADKLRAAVVN
jgi:hypothetical protein